MVYPHCRWWCIRIVDDGVSALQLMVYSHWRWSWQNCSLCATILSLRKGFGAALRIGIFSFFWKASLILLTNLKPPWPSSWAPQQYRKDDPWQIAWELLASPLWGISSNKDRKLYSKESISKAGWRLRIKNWSLMWNSGKTFAVPTYSKYLANPEIQFKIFW